MVFRYLKDFVFLLFPACCCACGIPLYCGERVTCTFCRFQLPRHSPSSAPGNDLAGLFAGRVRVQAAAAYYSFQKGGGVQQLIHRLKYQGQQEIGLEIGKRYGIELKKQAVFCEANLIIPVPLHTSKLRKRGYNQSACFARGLSHTMDVPVNETSLFRVNAGESQTRKSRFNRWKNVESVFRLRNTTELEGKLVLLVDDVVTTGATLEACTHTLLRIRDVRVCVAVMAFAATR